jgi:hypothetical protein
MRIIHLLVLLSSFLTVKAQRVIDHYSWQKRDVVQSALNKPYAVKIDGKPSTHAAWLGIADSNILSIQVYKPKQAKKVFGKDAGVNGIVLVRTFHEPPSRLVIDSTADSAKFIIRDHDTVFIKATKEATLSHDDKTMHQSWRKFLERSLNSSVPDENDAPVGIYIVRVSFIVQADGRITDIYVPSDPGYGTGTEVKRVLQNSAPWQPAMYNNRPVKMAFIQPVYFILEE